MQVISRVLIASAVIAVLQLTLIGVCGTSGFEQAHMPTLGPETLPENIGDFAGKDEPLDERVVTNTRADGMLNRVYRNRLGDSVSVNLGVWTLFDFGIPHAPDTCYPAAGWETVSRQMVPVQIEGQNPITVKQFIFQRGTSRIAVAYWVQIGDVMITDNEPIRKMRQAARGTHEKLPPLVKVMLHTDARDVAQAEARLNRFVANLVPITSKVR
jgi:EpsI family protein